MRSVIFMDHVMVHFFLLQHNVLFLSQMILGASKGMLFSHYHCHVVQLCNFISNLSVHIRRSACADTKQAQNNTKIILYILLKSTISQGDGCKLCVSSCHCPTSYPQKFPLFWSCRRKKRSLTVQTKGAHHKENEGVHFPHGSKKITVLQLRQLAIGSVGRDAQGRDVKANLNLGGMKCLERNRQ